MYVNKSLTDNLVYMFMNDLLQIPNNKKIIAYKYTFTVLNKNS